MPHPMVRLNHAVAVAMASDPAEGLALVQGLAVEGDLGQHHLLHATRADLLRRLGRRGEAALEYRRALECGPSETERRYLERRLGEVAYEARPRAS